MSQAADTTGAPAWWSPSWEPGSPLDPDTGWESEPVVAPDVPTLDLDLAELLDPEQVRSRDRVRDLAEVFTHQREVDAMLDQMPDAFTELDVTFLEPACGAGNFLIEILRRKLALVRYDGRYRRPQERYEHRLLRAVASIYGVDISNRNVVEARARLAHVLLSHYQQDANTIEPTQGFMRAAALILDSNIVVGDSINSADRIELCEWRPRSNGCFQRVWSYPLVAPSERGGAQQFSLLDDPPAATAVERVEDDKPIHYSQLSDGEGTLIDALGRL